MKTRYYKGSVECLNLSIRRRGFSHERDLVIKLWKKGFAVIRAPASGSKAKRMVYPDVVAIRNGITIVFEVKSSSRARDIYIDSKQIHKLIEFAKRAGGFSYIAIKLIGTGEWRFVSTDMLVKTASGRFKVSREAIEKGLSLKELVSITGKFKKLDEFLNR